MVDFQNRKKVYILCSKEEYATIWEHLHEIINVQEEELIIPYDFMDYKRIDAKIEKAVTESLKDDQKDENEVRFCLQSNWYERKFTHFKNFAPMASEIIITKNGDFLSVADLAEKFREIQHCSKLTVKTIRIVDMKELTHQKTI